MSHGRNETHAPIYRLHPFRLGAQTHIVAGYMCTPLVTFPVPELRDGEKVIGRTVAELGSGNTPESIISYDWEGESFLLVGNNRHPLMKFARQDLLEAKGIQVPSRSRGVDRVSHRLGEIAHLADYNEEYIVAIRRRGKDASLFKIPKSDL